MRGKADRQMPLFHTFEVEDRIRANHPLRDVKRRTDRILASLSPRFEAAYSETGRPSVPPERLLKAMLLMDLYSVRSERQLCEQIDLNLLFRWFLDMQPSEQAFDATTFTKNRERLQAHGFCRAFFDAIVDEALAKNLCSEHFSVDGTLIESYASAKSFQPTAAPKNDDDPPSPPSDSNSFQPRNIEVDFHGQKRTNETHQSVTDPEARLYRKGNGKEAKLSHVGHALSENRHGLIVRVTATEANGMAEREATWEMLDDWKATRGRTPKTLGGDKGYDDGDFLCELERRQITPHIPLANSVGDPTKDHKDASRIPGMEARIRMRERMKTDGYALSQRCRKKIEEFFGWLKEVAGLRSSSLVGRWKLRQSLHMAAAAFNLIRLRRLAPV